MTEDEKVKCVLEHRAMGFSLWVIRDACGVTLREADKILREHQDEYLRLLREYREERELILEALGRRGRWR